MTTDDSMADQDSTSVLVDRLDHAQATSEAITDLPQLDALDLEAAYDVQHATFARRIGRGERQSGTKLGFTSKAKMAQMGVEDIIVGELTDSMRVADGQSLNLGRFIHPRVEPEVAFRLGRDVDLTNPVEDVRTAVDAVAPALEVIDSRYEGFKFSLPSVVADNTSAAAYAVGPWSPFAMNSELDLSNLAVQLLCDGERIEVGSTAAILGHPLRTLPELAAIALRHGFELRAGFVILAGAATAAAPLRSGTIEARVAGLGRVAIHAFGDTHG